MVGFRVAGRATLRAGRWHGWRRFNPLATGLWLVVLTPVGLTAPTLLHGTDPATAVAEKVGDVRLQRA